jgi:hypothetical protein
MMMSKPAKQASSEEETSAAVAEQTQKPQAKGTVADLERRLAVLSTEEAAAQETRQVQAPPAAASAAAAPAAAAAKSGKNALLVRTFYRTAYVDSHILLLVHTSIACE